MKGKQVLLHDLHIRLTPKPHPYEGPGPSLEMWGEIALSIADRAEPLLLWQWDLALLVEWYLENHVELWSGSLPGDTEGESLVVALKRLQGREFPAQEEEHDDAWIDLIYAFRSRHSLRFALRGADTPEIIIGHNRGEGEISRDGADGWAYSFSVAKFTVQLQTELARFLDELRARDESPAAVHAAELAHKLAALR